MNAATVTVPRLADRSGVHVVRTALIALAVVILLAASFVVGRASGSTTEVVPATTPTPALHTAIDGCFLAGPC